MTPKLWTMSQNRIVFVSAKKHILNFLCRNLIMFCVECSRFYETSTVTNWLHHLPSRCLSLGRLCHIITIIVAGSFVLGNFNITLHSIEKQTEFSLCHNEVFTPQTGHSLVISQKSLLWSGRPALSRFYANVQTMQWICKFDTHFTQISDIPRIF